LLLPSPAPAAEYVEAIATRQVTGLENTYPAWSPDGSRIVFESTRDGPDPDIFVMQSDGSGVVQLTRNTHVDANPVWTPDGKFIVFASDRDGNHEIYRMRDDGSDPINLSRHPGTDGHAKVSPDGRLIYFNSNRSSDPSTFDRGTMDSAHNHEIYAMTLEGDNVRRLTDLQDWDTYPAISPDGNQLLWRRVTASGGKSETGRNSEVFWMNLSTGEQRNLTRHQAYDGWPAWSPDGKRIAFASNRANVEFEAFDIYVAQSDGSDPVRVTFGNGVEGTGSWTKPSFAPDGRSILCTRTVGSSVDIFVISLRQ
jgi:TolB protein